MYSPEEKTSNEFEYLALLTCIKSLQDKVDIEPFMFSTPEYQRYFELVCRMRKEHGYIIKDELSDMRLGEIYQGFIECKDLTYGSELDDFRYYQDKIRDAYVEQMTRTFTERYLRGELSSSELAKKIEKISQQAVYEHQPFTADMLMEALEEEVQRIPMGRFDDFNYILNLQCHDLCTITAETSAGKTALALNFLSEMLPLMPCVYFNMEMSKQQISRRITAIKTGIDARRLEDFKSLDETTKKRCRLVAEEMLGENNFELINGAQTLRRLKNVITTHDQTKTFAVFIDHMGFISDNSRRYENNTTMLDAIMREIRAISEEFNCVIINISQMSRPKGDSGMASISRLKGSSEIEQSSVQVLAIQRQRDEENNEHYSIDVLKNRNGQTGTFYNVSFNKNNQRFEIGAEQFE